MLEVHLSLDGLVVCAPISLLPQLNSTTETSGQDNLAKVEELDLSAALHELKDAKVDPGPKELCPAEKVATRQKLLAINHSLHMLLRFRLSDCQPARRLRPARRGEKRCMVKDDGMKLAYLFDPRAKQVEWQSARHHAFASTVRLSTLQDEGGATAAVQMANGGLLSRSRLDWCSSLIRPRGRHRALVAGLWKPQSALMRFLHPMSLVEMCAPGIIADFQMNPASSLQGVKHALCRFARGRAGNEREAGRWADYVDGFECLRKEWHCRLFLHLFALTLEGHNSFHALSSSLQQLGTDHDLALAPKVLRAIWLCFGIIFSRRKSTRRKI